MLTQFGPSTWVALLLGSGLAVLAFVPVAASRYRRTGRLRVVDVLVLLLVAVYAVALWSYTLVPLPEKDAFTCANTNFRPFGFVADIRADGRVPLRNRALLQAVFNVVLFGPLGFFLRVLWRRGVVVATATGLVISLAIELTQRTGVWGLYRCAYRVFDVDDLLLNTLGALLGSLVALPVVSLLSRRRPPPVVTIVTFGRRLVGFLADLMLIAAIGGSATITWRAFALYALGWPIEQLPTAVDQVLAYGLPAIVEGYWVLGRGRTLGEAIVQLEPVERPGTRTRSRLLKFVAGVGGYLLLASGLSTVPFVETGFAIATVVVALRSRHHRGLSHIVAGMDLRVERASTESATATPEGGVG
jgi:glycopeptide antibiotics resistance protein